MKQTRGVIFLIPLLVLTFLGLNSFFIVPQMQQAIVLQFGELIENVQTPGLRMKIPFIQDVLYYDKRMLDLDISEIEVTLGDQKRIVVNTFTRYKITDPVMFYKSVRNELGAQARLSALITSTLRSVLGQVHLAKLLAPDRIQIMRHVREKVDTAAEGLGLSVVEVRMKRADLPKENSEAIFQRMISERRAEAAQIRSKGEEVAEIIRANTDLECAVIGAEAQKQAQIILGQGDAEVAHLYREAYGKSPKFALLYRTFEAYKKALGDQKTTYVLSPESDFLKFFRKDLVRELAP